MPRLKTSHDRDGSLSLIASWWRKWINRRAATDELIQCGADEAAHIARDVGVPPAELRTLAGKWPDATELLSARVLANGLDADQVRASQPEALRDLQRVCTQCEVSGRCEHDLDRDPGNPAWRDYCPNVATLDALRSGQLARRLMRRSRKWRSV